MKTFIAAQVDAPTPPDWLLKPETDHLDFTDPDAVRDYALTLGFIVPPHDIRRKSTFINRELIKPTGKEISSYTFSYYYPEAPTQWVRENITDRVKDIKYCFTIPGRPTLGPHCDITRSVALIYLLQQGGDNPRTVFWKERGQDELIRPLGHKVTDYSQLEEVASITLPVNTWMIINARLLHSVENIPLGRKAIHISLDEVPESLKLIDPLYI